MARDALFPDGLVRPKAPYSPVVVAATTSTPPARSAFDVSGTLVAGGIAEQTPADAREPRAHASSRRAARSTTSSR